MVVGLVTENSPRMLVQAVRLLRSLRWFGGELAGARAVVCAVGTIDPDARRTLEELGAEIRIVRRFHQYNPTGNRHSLLEALADARERLLLLLDCDTVVVRDPLPYLRGDVFQAKIAPSPTVTDEVFDRLFHHFGIPKPPREHVTPLTGTPTIVYFNAGVVAVPAALLGTLGAAWREYNEVLADRPELVAPCHRHLHQAALSLAVAATGIPYACLPEGMNLQLNSADLVVPRALAEVDPAVIHYHHLATDDGFLLPTAYPRAQRRIDAFNARMRAEGFVEEQHRAGTAQSRAIVVLGMHRSGTSLTADVIRTLGSYAGSPDELMAPDNFNPSGYWEHVDAVKIDDEILAALSTHWSGLVSSAGLARLPEERRAEWTARARKLVDSLRGRESFVLKDPRMSLLFPFWREVLGDAVCVIAWRDPLSVTESLLARDRQPPLLSLAAWEQHYRTILRDTADLPRVLVSYDEVIADPVRAVGALHAELVRLGVRGLELPTPERIRQVVNVDFDRSRREASRHEPLLDDAQRALLESLRSGAALREPVPPATPRTLALLEVARQFYALRKTVTELDQLLGAVFSSRSWQIGHGATGVLRRLRRQRDLSAFERWQSSRRRRDAAASSRSET